MFRKKELENTRRYTELLRQVGNANRKIIEFESEIKRQTTLNRRTMSGFGSYFINFGDTSRPEVSVVDAVQLILEHLGLEVIENEKLSLIEKQEDNDG